MRRKSIEIAIRWLGGGERRERKEQRKKGVNDLRRTNRCADNAEYKKKKMMNGGEREKMTARKILRTKCRTRAMSTRWKSEVGKKDTKSSLINAKS